MRASHAGGSGGGRGQGNLDTVRSKVVQHLVQPAEVVVAFGGLQQRPGEDADAQEVDAGFLHQLKVLQPDFLGPLLRVVVAAVGRVRRRWSKRTPGVLRVTFLSW